MEPTVKKESAEKIPFLERSIVRTILPIARICDHLCAVRDPDGRKAV